MCKWVVVVVVVVRVLGAAGDGRVVLGGWFIDVQVAVVEIKILLGGGNVRRVVS